MGECEEVKELPPYFTRVNCAKILMELQLYDVRPIRLCPEQCPELVLS